MVAYATAIDSSVLYMGIDLMGLVSSNVWEFFDNSFLVTFAGHTYSLLDWFLIGGLVVDEAFLVYHELMP